MRFLSAIVNKPRQIPQQVLLLPISSALRGCSFHGICFKCAKLFSRLIRRHANAIQRTIFSKAVLIVYDCDDFFIKY